VEEAASAAALAAAVESAVAVVAASAAEARAAASDLGLVLAAAESDPEGVMAAAFPAADQEPAASEPTRPAPRCRAHWRW
jgi:hypothetical protein